MAPKKESKEITNIEEKVVELSKPKILSNEEALKLEYNKEITEEQLQDFFQKSTKNEDAIKYLAEVVLGLGEYTYADRTAIFIDFLVSCLMFAHDECMDVPKILLVYKISHVILDNIKNGAKFEELEEIFKQQLLRLSVKIPSSPNHFPHFNTMDMQRIIPFFMTTIFQHYWLYNNCFLRGPLTWIYHQELWVETITLCFPLIEASTMEEIALAKVAELAKNPYTWKILREKVEQEVAEAARQATISQALIEEKRLARIAMRANPIPLPKTLDEALDYGVRMKVQEAVKVMQDEYNSHEIILLNRCQNLEDKSNKK